MDNTFAQRLVNARKIRCMSQRELCNSVDGKVSPTAIAKYEKGLMMPSSDVLILLSNALNMKLDYFSVLTPLILTLPNLSSARSQIWEVRRSSL